MHIHDTICAIATAPGGAIGIIRVSGTAAFAITDRIFHTPSNKKIADASPYSLTFGHIEENGEIIDEVLVATYRNPHSYTGEDSTEIMCHGSRYILQKVMELLISAGARQALPGEYTQRAFLNGKMDLSQAEAVADVIASDNAATHRMAINQLRGGFGKELNVLREKLLHLTSLMELELDFSEEDVEFANRSQLLTLIQEVQEKVNYLLQSFQVGNALKNGIPVAIIGETNVGKSSLLNRLLHEDKAIVSNIHGTTRDVIEDCINIQGYTFRFIDTAGLRETKDVVENLGIERTWNKINEAQIILWLVDAGQDSEDVYTMYNKLLPNLTDKTTLLVYNKIDKYTTSRPSHTTIPPLPLPSLYISAQTGRGINELQEALVQSVSLQELNSNGIIINNVRHVEALKAASSSLERVCDGVSNFVPNDLISQDLRDCIYHLAEITGGEITTDEILATVFKNFCIGK